MCGELTVPSNRSSISGYVALIGMLGLGQLVWMQYGTKTERAESSMRQYQIMGVQIKGARVKFRDCESGKELTVPMASIYSLRLCRPLTDENSHSAIIFQPGAVDRK